jgi:pimeloyl-ACP methyl ester carboxylesterase
MIKTLALTLGGLAALVVVAAILGWLIFLRASDTPYASLEAKYAGPASRFVDLPDGVRLHYRDQGKADGPVLVLVHGYGDSAFTWDGWVARLGDRYRIISLDLPGHGLTRAPKGYRMSADNQVAAVQAVADAAQLSRFALAGNSMGGGVAWRYALAHPERLDALILDAAAGWPAPAKNPPLAFRILQHPLGKAFLKSIDNKPLIRVGVRGEVGDPTVISDAFIDRWAALQLAPGHRDTLIEIDMAGTANAKAETLRALTVPTLVLHGEVDPLIPVASGRKFAEVIPGAQLIVYPKIGHLPQVEIPERSADDVAAFLEKARASAQPK